MITDSFTDPVLLATEFATLAYAPSWKEKGVTIAGINNLINNNLQLIMKQTENPNTAPKLQAAMLALSDRISKEKKCDTPEGHDLAFKIMAFAQGLLHIPFYPIIGSTLTDHLSMSFR